MLWVPGLAPSLHCPISAQPQDTASRVLSLCSGRLSPCPAQEVSPGRTSPFPPSSTPVRQGTEALQDTRVPTQHRQRRAPSCQGRVCSGQAGSAAAAATCCLSQPLSACLFARPAKTGHLPGSAEGHPVYRLHRLGLHPRPGGQLGSPGSAPALVNWQDWAQNQVVLGCGCWRELGTARVPLVPWPSLRHPGDTSGNGHPLNAERDAGPYWERWGAGCRVGCRADTRRRRNLLPRACCTPRDTHSLPPSLGDPQGFLHEGQEKGVPGAGTREGSGLSALCVGCF